MFDMNDNFNIDMLDLGITIEEIDKLLSEMKKTETPLIRKTPEMIEKNPDVVERQKELIEFTWLHDLYITPLSAFAKRVCLKLGLSYSEIPSFSNLSIMGRMTKLRDFIISKGCTIDTIVQLVPKSTKEIELLIQAHKNGFDLGFDNISDLTNDNRLKRAKDYLLSNVIKDYNSPEVATNERNR